MTAPDLQARYPGVSAPAAALDAATRAGHRRRPVDLLLLRRVRDALVRLPDSARSRNYFEIPGDCLASPRTSFTPRPGTTGHRKGGT